MSNSSLQGKAVLITGGTGSFGKAFTRYLIEQDEVTKVVIFSRDEWKQWQMRESDSIFNSTKIRYFLGDVRDCTRLKRAFNEIDIIIHAAALKHVPAAEYNPSEFVKTNVEGAMNVLDAAIEARVEKVIALSTDKAVNPVNLYGATKLCSDKLFLAGNAYVGRTMRPLLSIVRYGNVLGSRGSLVPFWQNLITNGAKELPITDMRMTRFWITLEEAVQFVIRALSRMEGREIFVPKIPSMSISDLAKAMAPELPLKITGIRPGEKLHELLLGPDDSRLAYELDDCYMVLPLGLGTRQLPPGISPCPDGFAYASNTNPHKMSPEEIRPILAQLKQGT